MSRRQRGWTDAQALEFELPPPKTRLSMAMTYNGDTRTFYEWGRMLGQNPTKLKYRHQVMGWTPAQVLGYEPPPE